MVTCKFEGCDKPKYVAGLCRGHDNQKRKGKELTPLREKNYVKDGKKRCPKCGETKSLDEYTIRTNGYPNSACRKCVAAFYRGRYSDKKSKVDPESTTINGGSE